MDAQQKWLKAKEILNNNPSEEQKNEAIRLLNESVSTGHAGANFTLALIYYQGNHVEQDLDKACKLYQKALDLGFNENNILMAKMYIDGTVVEKNISKAEKILISLAEENDADACAMLGWMALVGEDTNLTNEEVWKWINKGASLGNNNCKYFIAKRSHLEGGNDNDYFNAMKELSLEGATIAYIHYAEALYLGIGCEKDVKEAVHWFELASEIGEAKAMCYLGNRYLDGIGVGHQDLEKGIELLTQSANLGEPMAMQNLGAIYAQFCEDEKATYWFDKAIEAGMEDSKRLKEESFSVSFDERLDNIIHRLDAAGLTQKALALVEKLYSNGNDRVLPAMIHIYLNGLGENHFGKDEEKAYNILSRKAEEGDAFSNFMIAQFYEKGIVVTQDLDKSFELYMKAAKAGFPYAQFMVGRFYSDLKNDKKEAGKWIELAAQNDQPDALRVMAYSHLNDSEIGTMTIGNLPYEQDAEKGMLLLKQAAELGDPESQYTLARCYQIGKYVEKDVNKAFELLVNSINTNPTPYAMSKLGDFYKDGIGTEQNYEAAAHCYQWAADNGSFAAMTALGFLYMEGKGVEKNVELANHYLIKSKDTLEWQLYGKMPFDVVQVKAQQGDAEAMCLMGERYAHGDGVKKDEDTASEWWSKAAELGHARAQFNLGIYYFYNKKEIDNGLKWLNEAARQNLDLAFFSLGYIYFKGINVEKNIAKGLEYITKAAELGKQEAQFRLSCIYHDGNVVEQDLDKARYWLEKYLEHDSPDAHYRMGICLYAGDMYDVDKNKALEHFKIAVSRGYHLASPLLLDMLWDGNGVEKDQEQVISIYLGLAEKNDAKAMYYLFKLYSDDNYDRKDTDLAIEYLKKSSELGYDEALKEMGLQFMEGGLLGTDINKAHEYFSKAAELGNAIAMVNLAQSYQFGRAFEKDIRKALELFISAAEAGEGFAAREASRLLLTGEEGAVEIDYDKAIELLQLYGNIEDPESCYLMAFALNAKCSLENSYSWDQAEQSFRYMLRAASAGHEEAMFCVAYSYLEGRGVLQNTELSRQWFEYVISRNYRTEGAKNILDKYFSGDRNTILYPRLVYWHEIAIHNPERINGVEKLIDENGYMNQTAVARAASQCGEVNAACLLGTRLLDSDPEKAWEYMKMVIDSGYTFMADAIGRIYRDGENVKKDLERAARYFEYGAERGDIGCRLSLGLMYTKIGVSREMEDKGKELLLAVCEASKEDSEEYKTAKTRLDQIEQRSNKTRFSDALRSLFKDWK